MRVSVAGRVHADRDVSLGNVEGSATALAAASVQRNVRKLTSLDLHSNGGTASMHYVELRAQHDQCKHGDVHRRDTPAPLERQQGWRTMHLGSRDAATIRGMRGQRHACVMASGHDAVAASTAKQHPTEMKKHVLEMRAFFIAAKTQWQPLLKPSC